MNISTDLEVRIHPLLQSWNTQKKIKTAIESNEFTIGIFLDLSKAFETVNHNMLLQKWEF